MLNQKGSVIFDILIVVFFLTLIASIYYFGIYKHTPTQIVYAPSPAPLINTASPSASLAPIVEFKKRNFDPNELVDGSAVYQPQLLSKLNLVSDDDLVGIRCGKRYEQTINSQDNKITSYYDPTSKKYVDVTDTQILANIQKVFEASAGFKTLDDTLTYLICEGEDGSQIAIFETRSNDITSPYYSYNQKDQKVILKPMPNIKGGAFFGCESVLQLTKTHEIYIDCVQGDGPSGTDSYYVINSSKNTSKKIAECTIETGGVLASGQPEPATISCK